MPYFLIFFLLFAETPPSSRKMAITIDDLPTVTRPNDYATALKCTQNILQNLTEAKVPAIGFVNEIKLENEGVLDEKRIELLQMWLDAGMELGNHAWSHMDYHNNEMEAFGADIQKGERVTRKLVENSGGKFRYFRHPYLHTGDSPEKQAALRAFLKKHKYIEAPVTVDNSEWIYARAYENALQTGNQNLIDSVGQSYMAYMEAKIVWYEQQSRKLFGYEIRQILLIHANLINADYLDDLIRMMKNRGYEIVTLSEALKDRAYKTESTYTGRGGISWLDRWALSKGYKGDFFKGEPHLSEFVQDLAGIRE
ncbi:MAG: polysaccharide deacetylase family protein [Bacteroidia bacterium]|nr:polysaccharide deacetylase family protein [Bacteroidia bacterium]